MSETIKGINVVIGSDTTGLGKALGEVNKHSKDLQSELREVAKLLKLDPRDTVLLAQKQKLLAEAVAATKEKLDSLRAAAKQVDDQFARGDISAGQHRAFQREVAKSESELKKFEKQLTATSREGSAFGLTLGAANERLKVVGTRLSEVGRDLTTHLTVPLIAAGAAVLALAVGAAKASDELMDLREQTGLSTDELQEWRHVEVAAGAATDTVAEAVMGLTRKMADVQAGGGRASDMFKELGVRAEDAHGKLRPAGDIMDDLVAALAAMENPLERNAIGAKLFGGAWKELAMILALGGDGIASARKEARDLGLVLSGETLTAAAAFWDGLQRVREMLAAVALEAGGTLAPVLNDTLIPVLKEKLVPLVRDLADALGRAIGWFVGLSDEQRRTIFVVAGLVLALGPAISILGKVALAVRGVGLALQFLAANPIGLVVLGIAALISIGVQLYEGWDNIVWALTELWTGFSDWWSGWWGELAAGVSVAVDKVLAPIRAIIEWVREALAWLDKLFTGDGTTGGRTMPQFAGGSIPQMAGGGVVTRPGWTIVGERGPELRYENRGATVVPLPATQQAASTTIPVNIYDARDPDRTAQQVARAVERQQRRRALCYAP